VRALWVAILLGTNTLAVAVPAESVIIAQVTPGARGPAPSSRPTPARPLPPAAQSAQAPAAAPAQPGQPAAPPPPTPQRTEITRFDNWVVTCNDFTEGPKKRVCSGQINVQQQGSNQVILTWTVFTNDAKQFVTALQTPTGILITPGVEVQPEKGTKRKINYESCDNGRCTAAVTMDNNMIREITAAPNAQVSITAMNGSTVQFNIPIKGFDKALVQLRTAL
jgi:invasion protein IalB